MEQAHTALLRQALLLHRERRLDEAATIYAALLFRLPTEAGILHQYAVLELQRGRIVEAEHALRKAIVIAPERGPVTYHRALALPAGSAAHETALLRAGVLDPANAEAPFKLAEARLRAGKAGEALRPAARAVELAPERPERHLLRAAVLGEVGQVAEALDAVDQAIAQAPGNASAWFQRGRLAALASLSAVALDGYRRALVLNPAAAGAANNIRTPLLELDRRRQAAFWNRVAVQLAPADAVYRFNLADARLASGDLAQGWAGYEWREAKPEIAVRRDGLPARWQGAPLDGGRLLVLAEQGVGDEIRFASCFADVASLAGPTVVECEPRLKPLFERSFPGLSFVATRPRVPVSPPVADYAELTEDLELAAHLPAGSAMGLVRRDLAAFPARAGYLAPDPAERVRWRSALGGLGRRRRIGISWRSGLVRTGMTNIAIAAAEFAPFAALGDAVLVNLQYGECEEELRSLESAAGVAVWRPEGLDLRNDLDRLAALVAELDLVIAIPNAVLCMAGAVGTPSIGLYQAPNFTFLGTERQPWFPNERPVLKAGRADWSEAIADAAAIASETLAGPD